MTIENNDDGFDSAFNEASLDQELLSDDEVIIKDEIIKDGDEEGIKAAEEPVNIWANANSDQRSAYDNLVSENARLSHKLNSDEGRVGALQRKINELQTIPSGGEQPTAKDIVKAMQSPEDMAIFKAEYPDMDDAIESRIAMADIQTQKIVQKKIDDALAPFKADKEINDKESALKYADSQDAAVESVHEGWKDIVASSEFSTWLDGQPAATKELIHSEAAEDAAALIGYFKSSQPQDNYSEANFNGGTTVTDIQRKRQKQLNDSAGIRSRSTRSSMEHTAPDDFDSAFDMYANS